MGAVEDDHVGELVALLGDPVPGEPVAVEPERAGVEPVLVHVAAQHDVVRLAGAPDEGVQEGLGEVHGRRHVQDFIGSAQSPASLPQHP